MIRTSAVPVLLAAFLFTGACASGNETAATDTSVVVDTAVTTPADTAVQSGDLLDPNSASREQLASLPGMTPALADSIVARRPFDTMLGVDSILARSLSERQRDTIYTRMFKPLALNTASREEILLIPGVGPRMQHEFEEYRPYRDMARFRRQIGKYVDSREVARLERYVRVD